MKKLAALLEQVKKLFDLQNLIDIFKHPEFHAREIPLLMALISILTLAIVIFYYISLLRKIKVVPEEEKSFRQSAYYFALFLGITLAALYLPAFYLISARSCLQCHSAHGNHNSVLEEAHKSVDCRNCHLKMGFPGKIESFFGLMDKIASINFAGRPPSEFSCCVSSANCLSCHKYVLYETVNSRYIRVSHREIFSLYRNCLTCHDFSQESYPYFSLLRMQKCLHCHDGAKARANCNNCHTPVGSPSKIKPDLSDYPKVTIKGAIPVNENKEPTPSVNVKQF